MMPAVGPTDLCALPGLGAAGCAAAGALAAGGSSLAAGAVTSAASAALAPLADGLFDGWWALQAKVLTFWTAVPTPTATDLVGPGAARGYVAWLAQFVLVLSVLAAAARTILTRDARSLAEAARTLAVTILVSAAGIAAAVALIRAGDAIASALLDGSLAEALGADPQPFHAALIAEGGGAGVSLLLGILGALASLTQFFVLLARNAVLPVVVLLLPLAAAAGGSALGRAWFSRLVAWLLALAFYKPVAAVIYAVVLTQARTADTAMKALIALVGMFTAVLALPALIKLFSPNPAGGGGGGGGYAVGMAAGAAARAAASRGGSP
jgi:hypothetical protein